MSAVISALSATRSKEIRDRVRRRRLVFVQCGTAFNCLRDELLVELGGTTISAVDFIRSAPESLETNGVLILTEVEEFTRSNRVNGPTLGQLRERVDIQLDLGNDVCLISKAPRIAYPVVPGSSVIEDASFHALPLLRPTELEGATRDDESCLPQYSLTSACDLTELFEVALAELGRETMAALDQAIFESRLGKNFTEALDIKETEALRGAGLMAPRGDASGFVAPLRFSEFSTAVGHALAKLITPQPEVETVMSGLWVIERTLRRALREAAIDCYAGRWRRNVLVGDLPTKVLERAQADAYVTAKNISELRDPIEWLSLGELLQIIRSSSFNGLQIEDRIWSRMALELLPIRNRLSHMRLIKKGDPEVVATWVTHISRLIS